MIKSRSEFFSPLGLLQLAIGLFFGLSGLLYISNYSSSGAHYSGIFGNNSMFNLLIAILELAAGVIYLIGLFASMPPKLMFITGIIILIIWILYIILGYFINNFLEPVFLSWVQKLSLELIVLGCIWGVTSQYVNS